MRFRWKLSDVLDAALFVAILIGGAWILYRFAELYAS